MLVTSSTLVLTRTCDRVVLWCAPGEGHRHCGYLWNRGRPGRDRENTEDCVVMVLRPGELLQPSAASLGL
jgi:hypothetical protein